MAEQLIRTVKCGNPNCGKVLKINNAPTSGLHKITCPTCKHSRVVNFGQATGSPKVKSASDAQASGAANTSSGNAATAAGNEGMKKPAKPDFSANEAILLPDDFLTEQPYEVICPHCNIQKLPFKAKAPGHMGVKCPLCQGKIELNVRAKTQALPTDGDFTRGKLVMLKKGWFNKDFPLKVGRHIIGRYDEDENSDIAIKNDASISRRSVKIEVGQTARGYTFKLTVLKATNPVVHNGTPLQAGEAVSLNFGDLIIMGKTKFRFEKDK